MTVYDEETWVRDLLAPLARIEPVVLSPERRRRIRSAHAAVLGAVALVLAAVALASGLDPLARIGAAKRPRSAQDVLNPRLVAHMKLWNRFPVWQGGKPLLDTVRLVGRLPDGTRFFVLKTTEAISASLSRERR